MFSRTLLPLLCLLTALPAPASERPNVLWITAEDMSPNLGSYGDGFARTPQLDAFARQAVRYTHAFATAPVCSPSRAALITGVYANSLGNPHLRSQVTLPPGFEGYPVHLRRNGYFTTNNVKTDYNLQDEARLVQTWWDRSDPNAHWRQRASGQPFMAVFNIMDTHQSRSSAWPEEMFEREIGSQLSADERADPSRVTLPPYYPDTLASRKAMARYYDCIAVMDRKAGAILAELEADGLAEDTIVFYYSDHGMGMPRGKRLLHDSGMRIPLLIRFPKKWAHLAPGAPGSSTDRLVNFADFAPTLLSLAGVPVPAHFQGVAFLGAASRPERRYLFGARDRVDEAFDTARSVRDHRWLYIRNYRPHLSWAPPEAYSDTDPFRVELLDYAKKQELGALDAGALSWLSPTRPREELYDTVADPHQLNNLAWKPGHSATLDRLRGALRSWLLEIRDVSFLPEEEVPLRSKNLSPYEMARQPGSYDLARVLAAAEQVDNPAATSQQRIWLSDSDSAVRYWAAVGFAANSTGAREARAELENALRDSAAAVRIEAAGALVAAMPHPDALETLGRGIMDTDVNVALHSARLLELLGASAQPLLPRINERLASALALAKTSTTEYYISMALGSLVTELEKGRGP